MEDGEKVGEESSEVLGSLEAGIWQQFRGRIDTLGGAGVLFETNGFVSPGYYVNILYRVIFDK